MNDVSLLFISASEILQALAEESFTLNDNF